MSDMILSPDEIITLTRKLTRPAQRRALTHMGVEHRSRPDGSLVVARINVERALGVEQNESARPEIEPNWAAV